MFLISIVIPVYKEAENISHTTVKIDEVLKTANITYEIIFVDDNSCDGTVEICRDLSKKYNIKLIVRTKDKGLANSVIEGLDNAGGDILVVMDADLSHPPSAIVKMKSILENGMADFVVGSRYAKGGSVDEQWSLFRRFNSFAATLPALLLVKIKDPMSGFFALRRENLPDLSSLSPIGYKIGLEIMVKGGFKTITEVGIHFSDRQYGQSKLNFKEQLSYLVHIIRLYQFSFPSVLKFFLFAIVGFSGFLIDISFYFGLQKIFNAPHVLARAVSFWPAVTWNWAMHRRITFNERPKTARHFQWMKFSLSSLISFILNWGVYTILSKKILFFQTHLFFAFITGIASAAAFNFAFSNYFVFPQFICGRQTHDQKRKEKRSR